MTVLERREYAARQLRARKSAGECLQCGVPLTSGKLRCERHLTYNSEWFAARCRARKEQGICRDCDAPIANKGGRFCSDHLARHNAKARERRHRRKMETQAVAA